MVEKLLIITSCSKKKLNNFCMAKDLYQGQFFKGVRDFSEKMGVDFWIISAKYGLIPSDKFIKTYNMSIRNEEDISQLKNRIKPVFNQLLKEYDKIFLMMGNNYLRIFSEWLNLSKISYIKDKRGIGGFNQLIREFQDLAKMEDKVTILEMINSEKIIVIQTINSYFKLKKK